MGRASWQHNSKEADETLSRWQSKAEAEENAPAICYSRCALLQQKDKITENEDSPWFSPGHLRCEERAVVATYAKEDSNTRPRAASDLPVRSKPTTIKLSGVPVDYNRTGFCEKLAEHGFGYAIDFLYLPLASSESSAALGRNAGHAFVNLRTKDAYRDFMATFNGVPASTCLHGIGSSDKPCMVSLSDVQGREANLRQLCTPSNLKKWAKYEGNAPLFLDDYGQRMALEAPRHAGGYNNGDSQHAPAPRARAVSDSCQSMKADSPAFIPQASSPAFVSQVTDASTMASPSMGTAESPEFVPKSGGSALASPSMGPADAPEFVPKLNSKEMSSPSLRAEAKEFVPGPPGMSLPDAATEADFVVDLLEERS